MTIRGLYMRQILSFGALLSAGILAVACSSSSDSGGSSGSGGGAAGSGCDPACDKLYDCGLCLTDQGGTCVDVASCKSACAQDPSTGSVVTCINNAGDCSAVTTCASGGGGTGGGGGTTCEDLGGQSTPVSGCAITCDTSDCGGGMGVKCGCPSGWTCNQTYGYCDSDTASNCGRCPTNQ